MAAGKAAVAIVSSQRYAPYQYNIHLVVARDVAERESVGELSLAASLAKARATMRVSGASKSKHLNCHCALCDRVRCFQLRIRKDMAQAGVPCHARAEQSLWASRVRWTARRLSVCALGDRFAIRSHDQAPVLRGAAVHRRNAITSLWPPLIIRRSHSLTLAARSHSLHGRWCPRQA